MADQRKLDEIAAQFDSELDVTGGKWFGKPCLKVGGKVFVALWGGDLAFKLAGEAHAEALQVEGAHLFDPRGKGHPMVAWVQIPAAQSSTWDRFARLACESVAGAAQARKEKLMADLVETRGQILDAASSLSPAEQDEVFLGTWSVKDLLAHLVGWDFANLESVRAILDGQLPGFYTHYDRDWQGFNAGLIAEYRVDDFAALVASVTDSHRQLLDFVATVPAEAFDDDRGVRFRGYKVTIGRTLQAEADDEKTHCAQIKAFGERRGALG